MIQTTQTHLQLIKLIVLSCNHANSLATQLYESNTPIVGCFMHDCSTAPLYSPSTNHNNQPVRSHRNERYSGFDKIKIELLSSSNVTIWIQVTMQACATPVYTTSQQTFPSSSSHDPTTNPLTPASACRLPPHQQNKHIKHNTYLVGSKIAAGSGSGSAAGSPTGSAAGSGAGSGSAAGSGAEDSVFSAVRQPERESLSHSCGGLHSANCGAVPRRVPGDDGSRDA
jgi:hypothetical protein